MPYSRPQPLDRTHSCAGFNSGEMELDRWLADYALQAQSSGSVRVFVTTQASRIAGYYALAAGNVSPEEATGRALKGQPRMRPVPVILLARLAVDLQDQGKGLGRSLLQDAMLRVDTASDQIGVRVMLVHAMHEKAKEWYMRFGFEDSPTDPLHLMILMKDIRAFLAAQQ